MYRYYITSVVIFLVFSLICGMALVEDNSTKVSVVAVGDNLIHPVVYHDAQHSDGTFNFKPMYSNIKKDIASRFSFCQSSLHLVGMIFHILDLNDSIHLVGSK